MPEGFLSHTKRWAPHSTPARELKRAMAHSPPLQCHHGGLSSKGDTSTHSFLPAWKENRSTAGTQTDGRQDSRCELENMDNTKVTSVSFSKILNMWFKPPKNQVQNWVHRLYHHHHSVLYVVGSYYWANNCCIWYGMGTLCSCRKTTIFLWLKKLILGLFQVSRSCLKRGPILKSKTKLWKDISPSSHFRDWVFFCSYSPCRNNIAHVPTQVLRKIQSNPGGKNQSLLVIDIQ